MRKGVVGALASLNQALKPLYAHMPLYAHIEPRADQVAGAIAQESHGHNPRVVLRGARPVAVAHPAPSPRYRIRCHRRYGYLP